MGAYNRVETQFTLANLYAQQASANAQSFVNALNAVVTNVTMPNLDVDQQAPAFPSLATPLALTFTVPSVSFPPVTVSDAPDAPDASVALPDAPVAPTLPTFTYTPGATPVKPDDFGPLTPVVLPDRPEDWTPPTTPTLLNVAIQPFGGIDEHNSWLTKLDAAPDDLVLAAPTAFVPPASPKYTSALLEAMSAELRARMSTSTGLAPAVEQALWDRARSREAAISAQDVVELQRGFEASGLVLPSGAYLAELREAQRKALAKSSELSRDIAMKQADLEQTNARHAIEQGVALEARLIEYTNNIEQRAFEAARFLAQNAVELYNAQVQAWRTALERYSMLSTVYRTLLEGERAKVDAYRAGVDAERAKVDINKSLIDQQRAQVEVRASEVELYKSEIQAAQMTLEVDRVRLQAFAERIRAYTAELNAEAVRAEVFKAQTQSNQSLVDMYKAAVEAWSSQAKALTDSAQARANIYNSVIQGYAARTQSQATAVSAAAEQARVALGVGQLQIDGFKAQVDQNTSNNSTLIEHYRALVGLYESNKTLGIQRVKLMSDNYFALRNLVADASKVAAQVNAQLAASAYSTAHVQASISGNDSTGVNFNYSGNTSDEPSMPSF